MASYPKDRFDQLPEDLKRVGAHRGPRKKGGGWAAFAWAALATGVLIFGGLFVLSRFVSLDIGIPFFATVEETETPTPTPTPTAEPVLDPTTDEIKEREITVSVLNGTPTTGLAGTVGDALDDLGWDVAGTGNTSVRDIEETFVYYSSEDDEDVARGLVLAIGEGEIQLVDPTVYPGVTVTIVLGADYPGAEPLETPASTETPSSE